MRLINTHTLRFEEFIGESIPPYAILSHTWEKGEVTCQEMSASSLHVQSKTGYLKIAKMCETARQENLDYVWVDTCCIDKTSSAELTEAINSMFQWYRKSKVCYAYLSDLPAEDTIEHGFPNCRWFTRGWTLQELIAPESLIFFDCEWHRRGEKRDQTEILSKITGIQMYILTSNHENSLDSKLRSIALSMKMKWASRRKTTRIEDMAYCLLGIFDVHISLIYGEGSNAFRRLQEEIFKKTSDLSLLAWMSNPLISKYHGVLAPSVEFFDSAHSNIMKRASSEITFTSMGLKMSSNSLISRQRESDEDNRRYVLALGGKDNTTTYLLLTRIHRDVFVRDNRINGGILTTTTLYGKRTIGAEIYLDPGSSHHLEPGQLRMNEWIQFDLRGDVNLVQVVPQLNWEWSNHSLNNSSASALVLALRGGMHPISFLVLCLDWEAFEYVYIFDYTSAATQYILHNMDNLSKVELSLHWNLEPARITKDEIHGRRSCTGVIQQLEQSLSVNVIANGITDLGEANLGFNADRVFIYSSLKGEKIM